MKLAPIVLFTYSRLHHTKLTIEALLKNYGVAEHDLIIFSDASRNIENNDLVNNVRTYLTTISGFKSVSIIHRSENYGLSKSIIEGVTEVLSQYERIIVLEDDMITSKYFLTYMNEALEKYANDDEVISVHGYVYPVKESLPDTFFLPGADCWGWGTWQRGWKLFNPDGTYLLKELKRRGLITKFNYNGSYKFSRMLKNQIIGLNDSWAIRWYASAFLDGKLTLYPGRTLIYNIGNDGSGTHCVKNSTFDSPLADHQIILDDIKIEISKRAFSAFEKYFIRINSKYSSLCKYVRNIIKR